MYDILLVEDEQELQELNKEMLTRRGGYHVRLAMSLKEARDMIAAGEPSLIVLDIMLPDGSGLDFLKELRQKSDIPVLLLTGLGTSQDVVRGLSAGGDDYLAKPYDNDELLARIDARLRKTQHNRSDILKFGSIAINTVSQRVYIHDRDILLKIREYALLLFLARRENQVLSAAYIYENVWGQPMMDDPSTVQVHISNLRKKLEGSGYSIITKRGEGYCFGEQR
jgi:DNA-binding response OmpR family regulator